MQRWTRPDISSNKCNASDGQFCLCFILMSLYQYVNAKIVLILIIKCLLLMLRCNCRTSSYASLKYVLFCCIHLWLSVCVCACQSDCPCLNANLSYCWDCAEVIILPHPSMLSPHLHLSMEAIWSNGDTFLHSETVQNHVLENNWMRL